MIPSLNLDELANMLGTANKSTLPQAFQNATTLAQRLLSADEWTAIKSLLGFA